MIRIRIPATSANLGPGFDCLGLALSLYNYVVIEPEKPFAIEVTGKYTAGIPANESNLIWRTMCRLWDCLEHPYPKIKFTFENNIPPARGLGSSSAAIVGGLLAANYLAGQPLTHYDLIQIAHDIEGHPDNITPALLGGLTLSVITGNNVLAKVIDPHPEFKAVVCVPNYHVRTEDARKVLPTRIPRHDAVFNIAHSCLLLEAINKREYHLLRIGMQDRIHQAPRARLVPGLQEALDAGLKAGAYGSSLSGSGPTVLALTPEKHEKAVAAALTEVFHRHQIEVQCYILDIDSRGAYIEDDSKPV